MVHYAYQEAVIHHAYQEAVYAPSGIANFHIRAM